MAPSARIRSYVPAPLADHTGAREDNRGHSTMTKCDPAQTSAVPDIIAALEMQLIELDKVGADIAAAHLESSIVSLRAGPATDLQSRIQPIRIIP